METLASYGWTIAFAVGGVVAYWLLFVRKSVAKASSTTSVDANTIQAAIDTLLASSQYANVLSCAISVVLSNRSDAKVVDTMIAILGELVGDDTLDSVNAEVAKKLWGHKKPPVAQPDKLSQIAAIVGGVQ